MCRGDLKSTREACQVILGEVFSPGLQNPPQDFSKMGTALLEGVWAIVPVIDTEAFLNFTKILCGIDNVVTSKFYSRALLNFQLFVHSVLLNSVIAFILRPILNFHLWFAIIMTQRFPLLAFMTFGRNICPSEQCTVKTTFVTSH